MRPPILILAAAVLGLAVHGALPAGAATLDQV